MICARPFSSTLTITARTIKRLLIEKVTGRVVYVDVTFGGFLGIGVHHQTIPWEKLRYDREFGGYRTDITAEQVRGAPQGSVTLNSGMTVLVSGRCGTTGMISRGGLFSGHHPIQPKLDSTLAHPLLLDGSVDQVEPLKTQTEPQFV